jgi:hypothetical protein
MLVAAAIVFVCYVFRGVWDVVDATGAYELKLIPTAAGEQVLVVLLFVVWELVPMMAVVALFGAVPATKFHSLSSHPSEALLPGAQFSLNSPEGGDNAPAPKVPPLLASSSQFLLPASQQEPPSLSARGLVLQPTPVVADERTPILRSLSGTHAPSPVISGLGPTAASAIAPRSPQFSPSPDVATAFSRAGSAFGGDGMTY